MRTAAVLGLLMAGAVAAPLDLSSQDGGPHGHGSSGGMSGMGGMGGMGGMTSGSAGASLTSLLENPAMMSMAANFIPEKKAYKIEEIAPKIRSDAKRIRLIYGPYEIKGRTAKGKFGNGPSMDPAGTAYNNMAGADFPRDVTVIASTSKVTDEKYVKAKTSDGIYNHHNVFFNFAVKPVNMVACGSGKKPFAIPSNVFMAGATENGDMVYTTEDGKFNSGFYIGPKDTIYNGIDVANYNNDTRIVYTVSEMEYVPGKVKDALPASQQVINLGMCSGVNGAEIHRDPNATTLDVEGTDIVVDRTGYLLQTRGHLHDGGINMAVTINGKEVCDSRAVYGGEGHTTTSPDGKEWQTISETTVCSQPIKVTKGDKLGIKAHYDFAAHPERETADGEMAEEMALLIITFAETA